MILGDVITVDNQINGNCDFVSLDQKSKWSQNVKGLAKKLLMVYGDTVKR